MAAALVAHPITLGIALQAAKVIRQRPSHQLTRIFSRRHCMNIHKLFKMLYLREIHWTGTPLDGRLITGITKACLCFTKMY